MLSASAFAGGEDGYIVDKSGKIVKSSKGYCVRTRSWSEQKADAACLATTKKSSTVASKR
jgi:hypothetical protein